jgi:hypothetical protein
MMQILLAIPSCLWHRESSAQKNGIVMIEETAENESEPETAQRQAAEIVKRLEELLSNVGDAREEGAKLPPPPERIDALISDALSLAEGISTGAIMVGQPRIASNLIEVVEKLDELGHHPLAAEFTGVLRWISKRGITAENCSLGRSRPTPGKY